MVSTGLLPKVEANRHVAEVNGKLIDIVGQRGKHHIPLDFLAAENVFGWIHGAGQNLPALLEDAVGITRITRDHRSIEFEDVRSVERIVLAASLLRDERYAGGVQMDLRILVVFHLNRKDSVLGRRIGIAQRLPVAKGIGILGIGTRLRVVGKLPV